MTIVVLNLDTRFLFLITGSADKLIDELKLHRVVE
jgi:hypothetical protein